MITSPVATKDEPLPVFTALNADNLEAIRLLGEHHTDMDATTSSSTPLMIAAANSNVGMVRAMLMAGARVNHAVSDDDQAFESHGVKVFVDPKSLVYIDGTELDFVREGLNEGFKFNNPREKDKCGCGESFNV